MASCKDCINYDVCSKMNANCDRAAHCEMFKDRSKFVELPCEVGNTVYFIRAAFHWLPVPRAEKIRKIELLYDNIVLFRTENRSFESKCIGEIVFLTKEQAEKALKELNNGN